MDRNGIKYNFLFYTPEYFLLELAEYSFLGDKNTEKYKEIIREKIFKIADIDLSYRVLNNWAKNGLLAKNTQEENGSWRKFSYVDICWILVIKELRNVGFSLDKIKRLWDILFVYYDDAKKSGTTDYFEYFIFLAMCGEDISIAVLPDGTGDITKTEDLPSIDSLFKSDRSRSYFVINFSKIVAEVFSNLEIKKKVSTSVNLTEKELDLIYKTRTAKNDDEIKVKIKNRDIGKMEVKTKTYKPEKAMDAIREMLRDGNMADITIKQQDGKVVLIERTDKT